MDPAPPVTTPAPEAPVETGPSVTMYDGGGQPHAVAPTQVKQAFDSGALGFAPGQKVNVKDDRGRVFEVAPEQAGQAFDSGLTTATDKDVSAALKRKEYNTLGSTAGAFGAGIARGATFGASDALATAVGGDATRQKLSELREFHPIASTAGELTGAVAPVLASGGLGAAAEGAEGAGLASRAIGAVGVIPRAVAGAGEAAAGLTSRVVGEGATSLLGRMAQRAIPMAVQGGVEGAAYGVGGQISEDVLGNKDITAEKLLAAGGKGALWGAGTGGLLGAAEVGARAVGDKALKLAGRESVEDFFNQFAQERAYKAIGGDAAQARRLGDDRINKIGERVLDYHFSDGEKLFKPGASVEDFSERINRAVEEQTTKLDKIRSEVGKHIEANPHLSPDVGEVLSKAETEIIAPMKASNVPELQRRGQDIEKRLGWLQERVTPPGLPKGHPLAPIVEANPGYAPTLVKQYPELAQYLEPRPVSIEELTKFRKDLDKIVYPEKHMGVPPPPPEQFEQLKQLRGIVEGSIEKTTENAATHLGNDALSHEYIATKDALHDLIPAAKMADKAVVNRVGQRFSSLSDTIATNASMGGLIAHGVGGIPAAAGGLLAGIAHKYIRERGSSVLAAAADKLATIAAIQRATMEVDQKVASGVSAFMRGSNRELAPVSYLSGRSKNRADSFDKERAMVASHTPEAHVERLTNAVGPISQHAPATAATVSQQAAVKAQYLQSILPPTAAHPSSLQPQFDKPKLSHTDMLRFAIAKRAVDDPTTIVDDMRRGTLSPDAVKAVKATAPNLLSQIQKQALESITDRRQKIPYEKRKQLGILLGIAADPSQEPVFMKSLQGMYAAGGAQNQNSAPATPKRPLTTGNQSLTATQSIGIH